MIVSLEKTLPAITHVGSSFGHWFMNTDSEDTESCFTCGGAWMLQRRADDPTGGDYVDSNGDDPMECSDTTRACHGYERVCQVDNGRPCYDNGEDEPCSHELAECNCLYCA